MTEEQIKIIVGRMDKLAKSEGYELTDNAYNIARAKIRRFGMDAWIHCPCHPEPDKFCISDKCKLHIAQNVTCHCRAYKLKQETIESALKALKGIKRQQRE